MSSAIAVVNDDGFMVDEAHLQEAAAVVLRQQGAAPGSGLTIVIARDEMVAALNRQYRGVDGPTDVLSFPAEAPPVTLDDEPPYLGDLILAYPYTAAQAQREGHDLMHSLMVLVAHGTLHLLGYDHDTAEHRADMWAAQEAALTGLGVNLAIVPALESYDHAK